MSEKPAVPGRPKILAQTAAATPQQEQPKKDEDPIEKMYRRRRQVADEILTTEASYCTSLAALVDVAIDTLSRNEVLTDEEQKLLFSNIATILQFNQNFCSNLDQRLKQWNNDAGLGDIFLTFTPFLKMYTQYVSNHEAATTFERTLSQQPRFLKCAPQIFGHPRMAGSSSLANFLIMPIQRIPRYSLLLTELMKTTPPEHSDLPALKSALEQVNQVAHRVNAEITAQQNRQMVYEKTQLLGLDEARFIQPSRYFVKQGPMTKVCRSKDSPYEFFLFNDVLIYASKSPVGKYKVHQEIPIDSSFGIQDAKDDEKRQNQFKIINSKKSFALYAETAAAKSDWMRVLTELIQKAKSKIQSPEEQGVIVPVWIPDDQAKGCLCCRKDFTFLNRKHHCRFCGGVVCGGCSKRKALLHNKEERICDQCVDLRTKYSQMQQSSGDPNEPLPEVVDTPSTTTSSTPQQTVSSMPTTQPPKLPTDLTVNPEPFKPQPIRYVAIADNIPNDVGDLPFKVGEVLLVYYRSPDGWWTATNLSGEVNGIFPSDLVKLENPSTPEPSLTPICSALIVGESLKDRTKLPTNGIMYETGQIVVVMHQLPNLKYSLSYNLTSHLIGWIADAALVPLNASDDDSANTSMINQDLIKQPSIPLPTSPPQQSIPSTPSIPPPTPRSGPPPAAGSNNKSNDQQVPSTPTSPPPSTPSSTPLPKPAAPPPARTPGSNTATLPPPAGANANKWDGPLPEGGCNNCKCEAYKYIAIRKAQCSDCGHGAGDHKAKQ